MTRARSLHAAKRTQAATADARHAVKIATAIADPSVQLLALDALLELNGSDELTLQTCAVIERIERSLPDDALRTQFRESEVVQRVHGRR